MGANTLTNLIPFINQGLDTVSRELVGFIPAVRSYVGAEQVAKDQIIRVPVCPANAGGAITPAATSPDTGSSVISYVDVTMDTAWQVPVQIDGEEETGLGSVYQNIKADRFAQAFRTITNKVELSIAALYPKASRAYGTAGTTPFITTAGDLTELSGARLILDDNGAPQGDLQLVINNTAMAALRGKQSNLFKVNEAGSDAMLRNGMIDRLEGFAIRQSGQVKLHTPGTGAATYETNAGYAAGVTAIVCKTGNGTILAGDVVTFESEAVANKYVTAGGVAAAGDTLTLNAPGLMNAVLQTKDLTLSAAYRANMAFDRNAIVLVARPPKRVTGGSGTGDMANDVIYVTDPISGLTFEIASYGQYRRMHYEVSLVWGCAMVKPEHCALLLG
jgi:hypothetical protein